jgi:hypothetical protein
MQGTNSAEFPDSPSRLCRLWVGGIPILEVESKMMEVSQHVYGVWFDGLSTRIVDDLFASFGRIRLLDYFNSSPHD